MTEPEKSGSTFPGRARYARMNSAERVQTFLGLGIAESLFLLPKVGGAAALTLCALRKSI
jgi:hypothetical protein